MRFPNSTPYEVDRALPDSQRTGNGIADAISRIPNSATRSRVQHAAYLLGVSSDMPEPTREEINRNVAIQSCYNAMNSGFVIDPSLESRDSSPLETRAESDSCELYYPFCLAH
jgi:hypothetical protein